MNESTFTPQTSGDQPTVRLALDVMGSDLGVPEMVAGATQAAIAFGSSVHLTLVGRESEIKAALDAQSVRPSTIDIVHATEEVLMTDSPAEAVRKDGTSVAVGLHLKKTGAVDAFVSPGNTGAVMAGSLLVLGRIPGVNRPAICAIFPTRTEKTTLLLDVGANSACKPINMVQFGALGAVYAEQMHGVTRPRVGLLSIGEERSKGNELIVASHELFEQSNLNFAGNVEGRDILSGELDVVVTDGFTGNVVLKFAESIEPFLTSRIRRQVSTNMFSRVGAFMMYPFLQRLRRTFDYSEAGGAPLLGIEGVVMICHGSSSSKAIKSALNMAVRMVRTGVIARTRDAMRRTDALQGVVATKPLFSQSSATTAVIMEGAAS